MGIFGDLFKEKVDWSENELKALWVALGAMAQADGNVDETEQQMIINAMSNLPGYKITNFDDFVNSANGYNPKQVTNILKDMHKEKRKMVVAMLYALGASDGNFDDTEKQFFAALSMGLDIKPQDMKS